MIGFSSIYRLNGAKTRRPVTGSGLPGRLMSRESGFITTRCLFLEGEELGSLESGRTESQKVMRLTILVV